MRFLFDPDQHARDSSYAADLVFCLRIVSSSYCYVNPPGVIGLAICIYSMSQVDGLCVGIECTYRKKMYEMRENSRLGNGVSGSIECGYGSINPKLRLLCRVVKGYPIL